MGNASKRRLAAVMSAILLFSLIAVTRPASALASTKTDEFLAAVPVTVSVYAEVVAATGQVTLSGAISSGEGQAVTIRVTDPDGGIDYVNQGVSGTDGAYSFTYTLDKTREGDYRVWAGGAGVAMPAGTPFTYKATSNPPGGNDDDDDGDGNGNGNNDDDDDGNGNGNVDDTTAGSGVEVGDGGVISGKPSYDENGKLAKLAVTEDELEQALGAAVPNAQGIKEITIRVEEVEGALTYAQQLPASALSAADAGVVYRIETSVGTIVVPGNMLAGGDVKEDDTVELVIGHGDAAAADDSTSEAIGDRPVIELELKVNGIVTAWNNPDAPATIAIPYEPSAEERNNTEHIVVLYIDGAGHGIPLPSGRYDETTGAVVFTTTHFSTYAVAYVMKTFGDIAGITWAKHPVEVMASKGIVKGTSDDLFLPGRDITRAEFVTLLVRTLGLSAKAESQYADVDADAYYYDALAVAKALGIAQGVGDNRFNPNLPISRQDMMTLAARALERYDDLQAADSDSADVLARFSDRDAIAAYAKGSVAELVSAGLIEGSGDGRLNPANRTTRAEAAVFLYNIYSSAAI